MHRYALMMHYCLTGNHLAISDINSEFLAQVRNTVQQPAHDRHKVWTAEQGLLQMVRTGDLNYRQALSGSMGICAGVPVLSDDALRQSKTCIIVFTSLVCRAAIELSLIHICYFLPVQADNCSHSNAVKLQNRAVAIGQLRFLQYTGANIL